MSFYEDVWTFLGKTGPVPQRDAIIIAAGMEDIRAYTGRHLTRARVRDTFEAPQKSLVLSHYPVSSIVSVIVNGQDLTGDTSFKLDTGRGEIRGWNSSWCQYCSLGWYGEVTVEYIGGFLNLPGSIIRALAEMYGSSSAISGGQALASGPIRSIQIEGVGTIGYSNGGASSRFGDLQAPSLNLLNSFKGTGGMIAYTERHTEILEDLDPLSPTWTPGTGDLNEYKQLLEDYKKTLNDFTIKVEELTTTEIDGGDATFPATP